LDGVSVRHRKKQTNVFSDLSTIHDSLSNDGSIVIKSPMSYIVSGHLQLLGYLAPTASDPILIATDDIGLISESPFSASEIQKYTNMINMPVFAVWAVPPQGMNNGGSTNGAYLVTDWQSQRASGEAPAEAIALTFYDNSSGALDLSSGLLTVATAGFYRHSMYLHMEVTHAGNFGVFVQINGLRHVGDFCQTTADSTFSDSHHFSTEIWHNAGDQVGFQIATTDTNSANGLFASWTTTLAYNGTVLGVPTSMEKCVAMVSARRSSPMVVVIDTRDVGNGYFHR
jgi:hypothetical protein